MNLDIDIQQNFKMNGKKLFFCETIEDIRELNDMTSTEAKALLKDIIQFKGVGVPQHLLGTVKQYVLCNANYIE